MAPYRIAVCIGIRTGGCALGARRLPETMTRGAENRGLSCVSLCIATIRLQQTGYSSMCLRKAHGLVSAVVSMSPVLVRTRRQVFCL